MSPIALPSDESVDKNSFEGIPPFPNTVPTAPLLRISLEKLLAGDGEEEERVWDASCKLGFFYLDLRSSNTQTNGHVNGHSRSQGGDSEDKITALSGDELLNDADKLFKVGGEVLGLSMEEKQKYDFKDQGSYFGYKGLGAGVVDKEGNKDRNEFYNVSLQTHIFDFGCPKLAASNPRLSHFGISHNLG